MGRTKPTLARAMLVAVLLVGSGCASGQAIAVPGVEVGEAGDQQMGAVATGRQALASVQGEPHVLWFWGAH